MFLCFHHSTSEISEQMYTFIEVPGSYSPTSWNICSKYLKNDKVIFVFKIGKVLLYTTILVHFWETKELIENLELFFTIRPLQIIELGLQRASCVPIECVPYCCSGTRDWQQINVLLKKLTTSGHVTFTYWTTWTKMVNEVTSQKLIVTWQY